MRVQCLTIFALLGITASMHASGRRVTVESSKTSMRVSFELPHGWVFEGPQAWPSYEEWYVGDPNDRSCGFTVRIDKVFARPAAAQHEECGPRDESHDETVG